MKDIRCVFALFALCLTGGCAMTARFERADAVRSPSPHWPPQWLNEPLVDNHSPALAVSDIVARVRPSVVRIEVIESTGERIADDLRDAGKLLPLKTLVRDPLALLWTVGSRLVSLPPVRQFGSGFFVHRDGLIATNAHVVANAAAIIVYTDDGARYDATLLGADEDYDLALLKINGVDGRYPPLVIRDDRTLALGEDVLIIGHPFNFELCVTRGIVSSLKTQVGLLKREAYIFTDGDINPGNSGGPLLDLNGRVVGIGAAGYFFDKKAAFAVPVSFLISCFDRLLVNSPVGRPFLGVELSSSPVPAVVRDDIGSESGVIIHRVLPVLADRLAAAGETLPVPCVIAAINGRPVRTVQDVRYEVARSRAGAMTTLDIRYGADGGISTSKPAVNPKTGAIEIFGKTAETVRKKTLSFPLPAEPLGDEGFFY